MKPPKTGGRGCASHEGKTNFHSGPTARRELERIRTTGTRHEDHGKPVRAYPCTKCGGWFLTSSPD